MFCVQFSQLLTDTVALCFNLPLLLNTTMSTTSVCAATTSLPLTLNVYATIYNILYCEHWEINQTIIGVALAIVSSRGYGRNMAIFSTSQIWPQHKFSFLFCLLCTSCTKSSENHNDKSNYSKNKRRPVAEKKSAVFSMFFVPSVLWHCWLGGRKGIHP